MIVRARARLAAARKRLGSLKRKGRDKVQEEDVSHKRVVWRKWTLVKVIRELGELDVKERQCR
jgi:hypothetical protein